MYTLRLLALALPFGQSITFTWTAPTTNVDGSILTDLRQYTMYEQVDSGPWIPRIGISRNLTKVTYRPTTTGTHRFRLTSVNIAKKESVPSNTLEINVERPAPQPSVSPTPD